jgi:hypothetical protein
LKLLSFLNMKHKIDKELIFKNSYLFKKNDVIYLKKYMHFS